MDTLTAYKSHLLEISKLTSAATLMGWDQQTYMPEKALAFRAEATGALSKMIFELSTHEDLGVYLEELGQRSDLSTTEKASVRVVGKEYRRSKAIPASFVEEYAVAQTQAQSAWVEARKASDFSLFQPLLEKMIGFARRFADYYGFEDEPYDAHLDRYEPGMTSARLREIITPLRTDLVPFIKRLAAEGTPPDTSVIEGEFDIDTQRALAKRALELVGYDFSAGALADVAHPFCTTIGPGDTRVNNRYLANRIESGLFGALHEGGHALYEQGMPDELFRLQLSNGSSNGMHESQSRMIENQIGRSRPFWTFFQPVLAEFFPQFATVSPEALYRAVNVVNPSFIRVEADEVTYNLHIMLRFELEVGLMNGSVKVADLPRLWDEAMEEYLGVVPPNDTLGVLQDVHWSMGLLGYFPSYMFGNLYAAQIFETLRKEIPALDEQIARGEIEPLLTWLREKIHQYGSVYEPAELIERITGESFDAAALVRYIVTKYSDVYSL